MHPNFYHWHARAELKPDAAVLEPRWTAAAKFAERLNKGDILSLLLLALFSPVDDKFASRLTEGVVKGEPTFPIVNNHELLRVMASAAIYRRLEQPSAAADAISLGVLAADFPSGRIDPVSDDITNRIFEYLGDESERVRPEIDTGTLDRVKKKADEQYAALKAAVSTNNPAEIG